MSLLRNTSKVLGGSALGFAVSLAATPILARIYSPSVYGSFAILIAVGTTFVGVSTARLEVRAQSEAEEASARGMMRVALTCAWTMSATASLLAVLGALLTWWNWAWSWVGVVILAGSLQLLGSAWLTRRGDGASFRALAVSSFVQSGGAAVVQVAAGLIAPTASSLTVGFAGARLTWLRSVRTALAPPAVGWRTVVARERRFMAFASSSAFINSVAGQMVIIAPGLAFGAAASGVMAMATRILVSPLSLVGEATSAAAIAEIGSNMRRGKSARPLVDTTVRGLFVVGAVPCVGAMLLAPLLVVPLLGAKWGLVGTAAVALAPGAWAQFAVAPVSQVLNMGGQSQRLLAWDVARLFLLSAAIGLPPAIGASLVAALWWFSAAQVLLYACLFVLARHAAEGRALARGHT